ncbi:MAG: CHC2 zinc finger domain-containing protein [Helicobacter sp.]|nr:CHC2 zinc finger domain-containing protein [Helicobacter sp.]
MRKEQNNLELTSSLEKVIVSSAMYYPQYIEEFLAQSLCPFHNEKTPSFVVNPNKNIFYCFGCGENGDSIKFVMLYKHLSFIEATQEVANMINFSLIFKDNTFALNFKNAAATLDKANSIFNTLLF